MPLYYWGNPSYLKTSLRLCGRMCAVAPQAQSPKATPNVSGVQGRSPWENFGYFGSIKFRVYIAKMGSWNQVLRRKGLIVSRKSRGYDGIQQ